jgi:opacity protein-like surface antigen
MKTIEVVVALLAAAAPAAAQDSGAVVAASVGVAAMNSANSVTVAGAGGYEFNRYVGLEVEVTAVPTLKGPFPTNPADVVIQEAFGTLSSALIFPAPTYTNASGRAVIVTNTVRVRLPTASARVTPFFAAGGGVASVRHTADYSYRIGILPPIGGGTGGIQTISTPVSNASTDVALTIGGGVAIGVGAHTSIDADLCYFRLLGSTDTNVGRFNVGVRYRFGS